MVYIYCVAALAVICAVFFFAGLIGDAVENVSDRMFEKKMMKMMKVRRTQGN